MHLGTKLWKIHYHFEGERPVLAHFRLLRRSEIGKNRDFCPKIDLDGPIMGLYCPTSILEKCRHFLENFDTFCVFRDKTLENPLPLSRGEAHFGLFQAGEKVKNRQKSCFLPKKLTCTVV